MKKKTNNYTYIPSPVTRLNLEQGNKSGDSALCHQQCLSLQSDSFVALLRVSAALSLKTTAMRLNEMEKEVES